MSAITTPRGSATHRLAVEHTEGERYRIDVRGHSVLVDQPMDAGGDDRAPTPVELFVGSLAACVAYYAGRYVTRHGFDRAGLRIDAAYEMATDRPARVSSVRIVLRPPRGFPAERTPALIPVARHCTVHNSLEFPPAVDVTVSPG